MLRCFLALLLVLLPVGAVAQAVPDDTATWRVLPSGLEARTILATVAGFPVGVELVHVPATGYRVRVVAREQGAASAAELAGAPGVVAVATANGQPVGERGCPYGWLVSDGRELAELEYRFGGVLWILQDGVVNLDRARMLITKPGGAQQAMQALDWLVAEDMPSPFAPVDLDVYSFVALDAAGRLTLGRSTCLVRGTELAEVLARPEKDGGAGLRTVLSPARGQDVQWLVRGAAEDGSDVVDARATPVPSLLVIERADAPPAQLPER